MVGYEIDWDKEIEDLKKYSEPEKVERYTDETLRLGPPYEEPEKPSLFLAAVIGLLVGGWSLGLINLCLTGKPEVFISGLGVKETYIIILCFVIVVRIIQMKKYRTKYRKYSEDCKAWWEEYHRTH